MAGIFPAAGTAAQNTSNAASPVTTEEGCTPLYHRVGCVPQFDPAAANAVISELVNAINTLQPYDCTRLDNLANVLATISDLCKLPTLAELGITGPDLDDTLAGCFDGQTGQVSVGALASLILGQKSLCGLQTVNNASGSDFLAGCFAGGEGYQEGKIPISRFTELFAGGGSSTLIRGEQVYYADAHVDVTIPTAGRDAFMVTARYDIAGGDLVGNANIAVGIGGGALVESTGLDNRHVWTAPDFNAGTNVRMTVPVTMFCNVIKKINTWYLVINGTAYPLGDENGSLRFANGRWSKMTIWAGIKF